MGARAVGHGRLRAGGDAGPRADSKALVMLVWDVRASALLLSLVSISIMWHSLESVELAGTVLQSVSV